VPLAVFAVLIAETFGTPVFGGFLDVLEEH
jgi:hypothetical protein